MNRTRAHKPSRVRAPIRKTQRRRVHTASRSSSPHHLSSSSHLSSTHRTRRQFSVVTPGRIVPGANPSFVPDANAQVLAAEHGRDLAHLQTREDVNLASKILEPNTYIPTMVLSSNLDQAKAHTRSFYRKILRMLPALTRQYALQELPRRSIVSVIRGHFEKHGKVTSPQVMDSLRWEGEVEFCDIVRMFHTQTNVWSMLFPDMHHAMLPQLPAAAAPDGYDPVSLYIKHQSSPFLQEFVDPDVVQRALRANSSVEHI